MKTWPSIQKIADFLARPDIIFYALPWLMVLVVLGTVSQKYIGLYEATQMFFYSIIFWWGPVPLPGGMLVLGLITISLLIKFLFYSEWKKDHAGIILTHLGILLLLVGGMVTFIDTRDGFMIIPEGKELDRFSDYRERAVRFKGQQEKEILFDDLVAGKKIGFEDVEIKILEVCENCAVQPPSGKYKNLKGLAANMELFSVPSAKNKEENFSGIIFEITKPDSLKGTYIVMEDIPKAPDLGGIRLSLGRTTTALPFSVSLTDFRKIDYPGTQKARDYESDIVIQDDGVSWPATIRMNEPFRYKEYSFYQSSFDQTAQQEITVLNVVKNSGRFFPYISFAVVLFGLLIHFFIRIRTT